MKNKKGVGILVILIPIAIAVILILLTGNLGAAFTGKATSLTPKASGCFLETVNVRLSGNMIVKDSKIIGVEPSISRIDDIQLKQLAILEPFDYKIKVINAENNKILDSEKGSAVLSSADKELGIPFRLEYKIPDNNCDGIIDDHDIILIGEIQETKDIFKNSDKIREDYRIRGGIIFK